MLVLYRVLLRAYPQDMRKVFSAEMADAVAQEWQRACKRGLAARARFAIRLFADFFTSIVQAWRPTPQRNSWPEKKDNRMITAFRELKLAARVLWNSRWSTAATILTLSLAIGATAAVFSVVHAVVLRPLPYADPDRLVSIWEHNVVRDNLHNPIAPANFLEWQDRARSFSGVAAFVDATVPVTGDGPAEELDLKYVSWNLFDVLGVRPALGRTYGEADGRGESPRKTLISWRLWQRRYNGDPGIVGRSLRLGGQPFEVIGVLPADFRLRGENADIWWQIRYSAAQREPHGRSWNAIARLKPGVTAAEARAEMNGLAEQLQQQWPDFDTGWRVTVVTMQEGMTGSVRTPLLLMFAAVVVVLLAGCANTINLLLARASARQREMAVRKAMGATRWHIARQLIAEGALLSAMGAAGGIAIAGGALKMLGRFGDRLNIPRITDASLDVNVLLAALGVMVACTALFSLVPAMQASNSDLASPLAGGGRWSIGHRRDRHVRQAMVIAQIACAVVLVVAGGMVTRSLIRLVSVDPGFDRSVYTFTVSLPGAKYNANGAPMRFYDEAIARLRATPGVTTASYVAFLPFKGMGTATSFTRDDQPPPPAGQEPVADIRPVDDAYFGVMRIPLITGRGFSADEVKLGQKVCVVSEATARAVFGSESPIGKWLSIKLNGGPDQIIGVVGDVRHSSLSGAPKPMIYYPFGRFPLNFVSVVARGSLDDRSMKAAAESIIRDLDHDIPVTDAQRISDLVDHSVSSPTAAAQLVSSFGVLALVLCLVGVGSLLAAIVSTRLPEFGVRIALGATPRQIRRMVLAQGGTLIVSGLVTGTAVSLFASRALSTVLFDVKAMDPLVYAGAMLLIAALGLLAADVPARRATRVNPADTLR